MQSAYAQYAFVPCINDAHTFLIFVGDGWLQPFHWKGQLAVSAEAFDNCRGRSSSLFKDYADRDLGSQRILGVA